MDAPSARALTLPAMTRWAQAERHALADLFDELGPDAPTLCAGWTTKDLAAHLVARERRPDAAPGLFVSFLSGHTENVRRHEAAKPWEDLVELVRSGPPKWTPMAIPIVDSTTNTIEFLVHHEDVRRAQAGWELRELPDDFEVSLWSNLHRMAHSLCRRAPSGVVLAWGDKQITARAASPSARVEGPPSELVLFAYGRQAHARVDIVADVDVATELRAARLGL